MWTTSFSRPVLLVTEERQLYCSRACSEAPKKGTKREEEMPTFLSPTNPLHSNQYSRILDVISPVDEVLQRNQPSQRTAYPVSQRRLAQLAVVARFVQHEVAAAVALGNDTREEQRAARRKRVVFAARDVRCPDRDEVAETERGERIRVPEADLQRPDASITSYTRLPRLSIIKKANSNSTTVILHNNLHATPRRSWPLALRWLVEEVRDAAHERAAAGSRH